MKNSKVNRFNWDTSAPGWAEVIYAFVTMVLMVIVAVEVMLF
jgi:hypothetical protein